MTPPATQRTALAVLDATGNRFLLADAWRDDPVVPARAADAGCDGVLELARPLAGGDVRMVLWNRDGSRARFCGNGLRCIAKAALERGRAPGPELLVETDSGPRRVRARWEGGLVVAANAEMGRPRVVRRRPTREHDAVHGEALEVDVGNPHLVLFVHDLAAAPLEELARRWNERCGVPGGVNVELVEPRADALLVRVHERGVGETLSCGSGVTAAALAAEQVLGRALPTRVVTRGGELLVERDGRGHLWTGGPVVEIGPEPGS